MTTKKRKPLKKRLFALVGVVVLTLTTLCLPCSALNQDIGSPVNHLQFDPQISIRMGGRTAGSTDYMVTLAPSYVSSSTSSDLGATTMNFEAYQEDINGSYYVRGFGGMTLADAYGSKRIFYRQAIGSTRDITASLQAVVVIKDDSIIIPNPLHNLAQKTQDEAYAVIEANYNVLRDYAVEFYEQYNDELWVEEYKITYDICMPEIPYEPHVNGSVVKSELTTILKGYTKTGSHVAGDTSSDSIGVVPLLNDWAFKALWNADKDRFSSPAFYVLKNVVIEANLASTVDETNTSWNDRLIMMNIYQPRIYDTPYPTGEIQKNLDLQTLSIDKLFGETKDIYAVVSLEDFNVIDWLTSVGDFFQTEIFGSVSLGDILWFIVGTCLLIMFLAMFAGG